MARSCAICGKTSMAGFNPQSVGMIDNQKGVPTKSLVCTRCRRTLSKASR